MGLHLPATPELSDQGAPEPEPKKMANSKADCRSPVGLDGCNCCLALANRSELQRENSGENSALDPPSVSNFRQLQEKLIYENLNTDKLNRIMRQDSLEPVLSDPCYLIKEGICNRKIDQTMLSILLFFHRWVAGHTGEHALPVPNSFCWTITSVGQKGQPGGSGGPQGRPGSQTAMTGPEATWSPVALGLGGDGACADRREPRFGGCLQRFS